MALDLNANHDSDFPGLGSIFNISERDVTQAHVLEKLTVQRDTCAGTGTRRWVYDKDFTPPKVHEWTNLSLFDLVTSPFELCLHKYYASLASSSP
jgi:hypothetical protein